MFSPGDLQVESITPSTSGGMNTGYISPWIRITHIETGCYAECSLYRHQYKNKAEALKLLEKQFKDD